MKVQARHRIEQSPLCDAPPISRGVEGHVEDETDGWAFVDFGDPYGVVACGPDELVAAGTIKPRVCDVTAAVIREQRYESITAGDSYLLHVVAGRAGITRRVGYWIEAAVLNALSKQPGELIRRHMLVEGRTYRAFWLPEKLEEFHPGGS